MEFEQPPGTGNRQGSLTCCSPWGRKELDTTEQLNNKNSVPRINGEEKGVHERWAMYKT